MRNRKKSTSFIVVRIAAHEALMRRSGDNLPPPDWLGRPDGQGGE